MLSQKGNILFHSFLLSLQKVDEGNSSRLNSFIARSASAPINFKEPALKHSLDNFFA